MSEYRYRVDRQDVIESVTDAWLDFAVENDAHDLSEAVVVGSSLWGFIAGAETRHIYRTLFEGVRKRRTPVTVPFRCDSPDRRRFMSLTILPGPGESLELVSNLIREESRPAEALLDASVPRTSELITMCAWCKHVFLEQDVWIEPDEAVARLALFEQPELPMITHGICPACRVSVEEVIKSVATV